MKIRIKISLIFIFFCNISASMFAQSTEYIQAKVLDSLTEKPISFAAIILRNHNLGLYANEEGDFIIKIKSHFISDSIIISCIGYNKKIIKFKKLDVDNINYIYLSPAIVQLKEVELLALRKRKGKKSIKLKKISSKKLIKKAIENIPKNYPINPFNYVSYYRDYQKSENEYINLNEALIHTVDNGFNTETTFNKSRLLDFKKNLKFSRKEILYLYDSINAPNYEEPNKFIPNATLSNQGGNEFFILRVHDPIRNFRANSFSFINIFSKNFLMNHTFSKIEHIYNHDLLLYKVKFKSKKLLGAGFVNAFGEIIIQPNDFSIHKIEYTCFNMLKNEEIFNVKVEYGYSKSMNSLMQLKYISFNNLFKIIDETDTDYFKIVHAKVYDSYLKIDMSNLVNKASVSNKEDYRVFNEDGYNLKIKNIKVKDSTIFVNFKNDDNVSVFNFDYEIKGEQFKSLDGDFLNKKKLLKFYQYRELFVQENNVEIKFTDSNYLQNSPLINNNISNINGVNKYWMNTPKGITTN